MNGKVIKIVERDPFNGMRNWEIDMCDRDWETYLNAL